MNTLKAIWQKLPENWKTHIVSFFHTFVAVFALFVIGQLYSLFQPSVVVKPEMVGDFNVWKDVLLAIGAGAFRAALKAALAKEVVPTPPAK